jgi:hypothetical protein
VPSHDETGSERWRDSLIHSPAGLLPFAAGETGTRGAALVEFSDQRPPTIEPMALSPFRRIEHEITVPAYAGSDDIVLAAMEAGATWRAEGSETLWLVRWRVRSVEPGCSRWSSAEGRRQLLRSLRDIEFGHGPEQVVHDLCVEPDVASWARNAERPFVRQFLDGLGSETSARRIEESATQVAASTALTGRQRDRLLDLIHGLQSARVEAAAARFARLIDCDLD